MEHKNPWISIWTHPRATIARIVLENPNRSLWLLAAIYGFSSVMNTFQSMAWGNSMGTIQLLLLAIVIAPFWGWVNFSLWSLVVFWVGRLFKGAGHFTTIRAAYSWSSVPLALNIPIWLLMIAIFGHQLFLNFPDAPTLPNGLMFFLFSTLVIKVVLAVWSLVIYLNALAQVQSFSMVKAIFNVVLSGVVVGLFMFFFWTALIYAFGGVAASPLMLVNPF
jgi:hypothetical protein